MNRFLFTALATSLVSATGFATDTEWPELDRELAALNNAPLTQDDGGPTVSGWMIGGINSMSVDGVANDDLNVGWHGIAVNIGGSFGHGYEYRLGFDFTDSRELYTPTDPDTGPAVGSSGTAGLTDAFVKFGLGDSIGVKVGVFNRQFLNSSHIQRNRTVFVDRSYLGRMYSARDAGFALDGAFDRIGWEVAFMNGHDGNEDSFQYSAHIDVDILGTSSSSEGGHGAAEGTNLNIGFSYMSDGSDTTAHDVANKGATAVGDTLEDDQMAIDATFTAGSFGLWMEMVDQDTDSVSYQGPAGEGSTPYSVGLSYCFGADYELAFRWDDYDNVDNVTRQTVGFNKYISGHDLKWQLNISTGDSDAVSPGADEADVITLGIAAGF
jgi:hypothetical protein